MGLGYYFRTYVLIVATVIAFNPFPIPPIFMSEPETVTEARLQDLRHFRHVGKNERSFTEESRAAFDARLAEVTANIETLTDAEFMLGLAQVQATIDNGHSNTSYTRLVQNFPRLPVRSAWFEQELRILRVLPGFEDLLGAEITHINDVTVMSAASAFRSAFGGNDQNFAGGNPLLLETPAMLTAVGMMENETDVRLRLVLPNGVTVSRTLSPVEPTEGARRIYPEQLQFPWNLESANWIPLIPASRDGEVPLYLRYPEQEYWMEVLPETNAVYINMRRNYSDDDMTESLTEFLARISVEIAELSPRTIIVDHRMNSGGDFTKSAEFMTSLGELVGDGRIYMLTGGSTFSAGIVNLAFAEQAAPEQVFFVGSPIGDRLQFWAEGAWFDLPNSKFFARFSTGYYDLQNGCEGLFRCHWGSLHLMPLIVNDLDVDIAAPMTFEDYVAGRDPAMRSINWGEMARQWDREDWDTLNHP